MKKLILILSLLLCSFLYSQEKIYTDVPFSIYGVWQNFDNEFVKIYTDLEGRTLFQRVKGREVLAVGEIKRVNDELHIIRNDIKDSYNLVFIARNNTLVIMKPRSDQAWLWQRVGN
jgi:hypothetical protein